MRNITIRGIMNSTTRAIEPLFVVNDIVVFVVINETTILNVFIQPWACTYN